MTTSTTRPPPSGADLDGLLAHARQMADLADGISLPAFGGLVRGQLDVHARAKPGERSASKAVVSDVDEAVERALRGYRDRHLPHAGFVGEEFGADGAGRWRRVRVDPLDATSNYVRGLPAWATLVSLEDGGETLVAVASAPALGQRWWACRGQGAWTAHHALGSWQLHVSAAAELFAPGVQLAYGDWPGDPEFARLVRRLTSAGGRTRGIGDFLMFMYLAEGSVDAVRGQDGDAEEDLLVPKLIIEEAGGRLTDLNGEPTAAGGVGIATNGLFHDEFLQALHGGTARGGRPYRGRLVLGQDDHHGPRPGGATVDDGAAAAT